MIITLNFLAVFATQCCQVIILICHILFPGGFCHSEPPGCYFNEEETDEESEEDEEDDDEMEHSGTESDKAVSMPPDIIAITAPTITGELDVSSSPPPAASEDHVTTEDTPTDAEDTPIVATDKSPEPAKKVGG